MMTTMNSVASKIRDVGVPSVTPIDMFSAAGIVFSSICTIMFPIRTGINEMMRRNT